ncbi:MULTISPECIES: helix-turn-helix domain-containing protein [unclassified Paenibacillus]|uniref:ArsR/SmtB family transcription factor n=1 Tax=unclassified Paenibacillus TaxID=185978 RepID=UPI001F3B6F86|nr:helix-turn-helix domain-containing protein [Paenibacillus sp. JJ-223]CAH1210113.1 hypothetical protein PAECIP111890_03416 [Paenibacillus sp. JJ-223]
MLELSFDDPERLAGVAHALSARSRIDILQLLQFGRLNVIEIAEALDLPISTVANHVKVLEAAQLIHTEMLPATRGAMKLCSRVCDAVHMELRRTGRTAEVASYEVQMPIGHYSDCEVTPSCGMASAEGIILKDDDPASFYHPLHIDAQLIWLQRGYVEYLLPVDIPAEARILSLELSMEMCSEVPNYNNVWPSDISVWINGVVIGTWTSPGDFGDRRGKLNPAWWNNTLTQYGHLKVWQVNESHTSLDHERISSVNLHHLRVLESPKLRLRIGIDPNAVHQGGMNLFGSGFGDHAQHIRMSVMYSTKP